MSRFLGPLFVLALLVSLSGACDWFAEKQDDSSSAEVSTEQTDSPSDDSKDEQTEPGERHLKRRHGGELGHHADDGEGHHHEIDDEHGEK